MLQDVEPAYKHGNSSNTETKNKAKLKEIDVLPAKPPRSGNTSLKDPLGCLTETTFCTQVGGGSSPFHFRRRKGNPSLSSWLEGRRTVGRRRRSPELWMALPTRPTQAEARDLAETDIPTRSGCQRPKKTKPKRVSRGHDRRRRRGTPREADDEGEKKPEDSREAPALRSLSKAITGEENPFSSRQVSRAPTRQQTAAKEGRELV